MSFDEDRFMNYFQPTDSDELVPLVAPEDLEDFESNVEKLELEAADSFKTRPSKIAIKGLIKLMEANPYYPRPGDLAGPLVDSSVYPPVQLPGVRIYRPISRRPHVESGL